MTTRHEREMQEARRHIRNMMTDYVRKNPGVEVELYPFVHRIVMNHGAYLSHKAVIKELKEFEKVGDIILMTDDKDEKNHRLIVEDKNGI